MTEEEQTGLTALTERRDGIEIALGDSLDVKANIWLVVITFLAAVDGGLLRSARSDWLFALLLAAGFLAASGVATIWALWPREYEYPPEPRLVAGWISDLGTHYREAGMAWAEVRRGLLARALERVESNRKLNRRKSGLLVWAYRLFLPALFLTLAVLIRLAWKRIG